MFCPFTYFDLGYAIIILFGAYLVSHTQMPISDKLDTGNCPKKIILTYYYETHIT